jgi:WD40 repeat protein
LSPDGLWLVSGNQSGVVQVWSLVGPPLTRDLPQQTGLASVMAAEIDREATRVAVGNIDGAVVICHHNGQSFQCGDEERHVTPVLLALSPAEDWLAIAEGQQGIRLQGPSDETPLLPVPAGFQTNSLAFSSDGKTLAASGMVLEAGNPNANSGNMVILWDVTTGVESAKEPSQLPVTLLAFSPTQDGLLAGAAGNEVYHWSVSDGEMVELTPFDFRYGQASSLAFAPDGEKLASGNMDGSITVWNASGELSWDPHVENGSDHVLSLTFSPDGRYVASGTEGGNVTLWDVVEQEQIGVVAAVKVPVVALAWLAGERETLLLVDRSGAIRDVEISLDFLSNRACSVAGRGFSGEEAQRYFGTDASEVCRSLLGDVGV